MSDLKQSMRILGLLVLILGLFHGVAFAQNDSHAAPAVSPRAEAPNAPQHAATPDATPPLEELGHELRANSFRFRDGQLLQNAADIQRNQVSDSESIGTQSPARQSGLRRSPVQPDGTNWVFDWYDSFSQGYCTGKDAYRGVDVSRWNGDVNWKTMKDAGVQFAIIRCGVGGDQTENDDIQWLNNVRGCQENELPFGVYLYAHAKNAAEARGEADHVLRCLRTAQLAPGQLGYPVYYDLEDESIMDSDLAAIATAFCSRVQGAGYPVGVYSAHSWWQSLLADPCFDQWYRWVAVWNTKYGLTYSKFKDFRASKGIWQFSNYGHIPGINTSRFDLNYTYMEPLNRDMKFSVKEGTPYKLQNRFNASLVLDASGVRPSENAAIKAWSDNGGKNQQWTFKRLSDGSYEIANVARPDLVLTAQGAAPTNDAPVLLCARTGGKNQAWKAEVAQKGAVAFRNAARMNCVLDANGSAPRSGALVSLWPMLYRANQQWQLKAVVPKTSISGASIQASDMIRHRTGRALSPKLVVKMYDRLLTEGKDYVVRYNGSSAIPVEAGSYRVEIAGIGTYSGTKAAGTFVLYPWLGVDSNHAYSLKNGLNTSLILDAAGVRPVNGASVMVYGWNGRPNQRWKIVLGADGYYVLHNGARPDLVLDASGVAPANDAAITAWPWNGGKNQKWVAVRNADQSVCFYNAANMRCVLDANGTAPRSGASVSLWPMHHGANQRWKIVK